MKMEAEAAVTRPQAQEGREPAGLTGRMAPLLGLWRERTPGFWASSLQKRAQVSVV